MGRPSSGGAQQRGFVKAKRRRMNKTAAAKPIKVVYISNPMRVTTSAAKFRGLVQRLTGRDSTVNETPVLGTSSFVELGDDDDDADELSAEDSGPGSEALPAAVAPSAEGCVDEEALWGEHLVSSDSGKVSVGHCMSEEAAAFEVLDDSFAPSQVLEQLPAAWLPQSPSPSSSLCWDSLISTWILENP